MHAADGNKPSAPRGYEPRKFAARTSGRAYLRRFALVFKFHSPREAIALTRRRFLQPRIAIQSLHCAGNNATRAGKRRGLERAAIRLIKRKALPRDWTTDPLRHQDAGRMFADLGNLDPIGHLDPKRCCLFLDLDGTLIDIASRPDGVSVPADLGPLIGKLIAGLDGALAIITGRSISDIDRFLAPLRPAAAGVHGAELRMTENGTVSSVGRPIDLPIAARVADLESIAPGILVESKKFSIAVHYRLAPQAVGKIERALRDILRDGPDHLIISESRRVLEVVSDRISKGDAVKQFMRLPAFHGRIPIMIGDDSSDESALDAVMRAGGIGLRVAGEHFATDVADFCNPGDVRRWLQGFAERLGA